MMLNDINIYDHIDVNEVPTGTVVLNVNFVDNPSRTYVGALAHDASRTQVVDMLRELALHIEYDITGEAH
jgi:hypothetical protein